MKGSDATAYCVYCFANGHDLSTCEKAGRAGLLRTSNLCPHCLAPTHEPAACTKDPDDTKDQRATRVPPEMSQDVAVVVLRLQDELVKVKSIQRAQLKEFESTQRTNKRLRAAVRRLGAHLVYVQKQKTGQQEQEEVAPHSEEKEASHTGTTDRAKLPALQKEVATGRELLAAK